MKKNVITLVAAILAVIIGIILIPVAHLLAPIIIIVAGIIAVINAYRIFALWYDGRETYQVSERLQISHVFIVLILVVVIFIAIILTCRSCNSINGSETTTTVPYFENLVVGDLDVLGDVNVGGDVNIGGNANVTGDANIGGDVSIDGTVNCPETTKTSETTKTPETTKVPETTKTPETTKPVHKCKESTAKRTEPTCTTAGKIESLCSCGKVVKTEVIKALGHDYDKEIIKEATITSTGLAIYTCTRCGASYDEVIAKVAHTCKVADTKRTEATCETAGKIEEVCSCGKVLSTKTIKALGHDYSSEVVKAATENSTGTKKFTCERCGDSYTESIPKLDHTCKAVETKRTEATCETAGKIEEVCSCGKVLSTKTIDALGHNCSVNSYKVEENKSITVTSTCSDCNNTYKFVVAFVDKETGKNVDIELVTKNGRKLLNFVNASNCVVKICTTGKAGNLVLQQSKKQFEMKAINANNVELVQKSPNVGGTFVLYDEITNMKLEFIIVFNYD